MDYDKVMAAHSEWKTKLRGALLRQEKLDAANISRDDCCSLGKWIHGPESSSVRSHAAFGACKTKHAEFHREAGKVAAAINAARYAEAETLLGSTSAYSRVSSEVITAILSLKKAVAPAPAAFR
ncbi:MAG: CZB domain-containing protein [Myxococcales bacterium]|nr:CZB domain-containing protein [Myxococcales bacterium]